MHLKRLFYNSLLMRSEIVTPIIKVDHKYIAVN